MFLLNLRSPKFKENILKPIRTYYAVKKKLVKDENYLARHIFQKIKVKGPITIADYMKEVLTHPVAGYYMHKDVFGECGDFVTSPEITQMFGEMIAVWFLNEWQKMGSPTPLQIVELGPGRGTLCKDILKVFSHFKSLHNASLHLVEVSPIMSELQAKQLCNQTILCDEHSSCFRKGISHQGIPVQWYKQLSDVPSAFTLLIAHEFFDALPIHKFHKTYNGYREVLVDIAETPSNTEKNGNIKEKNSEYKFKYVLARHETPMSKVLIKPGEKREHIEISPEALRIYAEICDRLKKRGGIGLICDYGHSGMGGDTFRAFRKHKQVDPLSLPGSADLTADVDFNIIKEIAAEVEGILTLGPVTQREFLISTGLQCRLKTLAEKVKDPQQLENLNNCFNFLVDNDKMGERFKFCALFPETVKKILERCPVIGFV